LRTFNLRLVSEAIGQFGFIGQLVGDATRASLLASELPASGIISSVTLDRGLFVITGLIVTIAGFAALLFMPAVPGGLRLYAGLFAIVLVALLALSVWAVRRGWPVLSGTARVAARIPWLKKWLHNKESVILSAEQQLLRFHRQAPGAFWGSALLNFVAHGLAIGEVYLILLLMGSKVTLAGALMLEALTKLINAAGTINPGNVGTYEGGNMAIVKLVGLKPTEGLTLGLCRRFRSIVWAIIGGICLLYYSRSKKVPRLGERQRNQTESNLMSNQIMQNPERPHALMNVAIVLANQVATDLSHSALAKVGALPLVLRAILSARSAGADRVIVAVDPADGTRIRQNLTKTRRLPDSVEWLQTVPESAIGTAVRLVASDAEHVILIRADRSFHPSLYRNALEWTGTGSLEFVSGDELIGLTVLPQHVALDLKTERESGIISIEDVREWLRARRAAGSGRAVVSCNSISQDMWQAVASEQDRLAAENKLDHWLVKPTDGLFAQMNRRISIPISRQLIKFPITPNMVTLFTLGVSLAAGIYYALGGYWNVVIGSLLGLLASILDGSDGEVARLKLQSSAFGCWLETICDYLYYLFIFAGMAIGLTRSWHTNRFLYWGAALFFGAIVTFLITGVLRQRLAGDHPEQYLAVWQKEAETRLSNPLMYVGRYCEFVLRRCFLPYALLVLALFNFTPAALYASAIGANVAWLIALYSYVDFTRKMRAATKPAANLSSCSTGYGCVV
jgi:phosphatidylglycerophosphate synthase